MRLTKTLRIFLCCLVVISVGVVFLGQSTVWAKNILSYVLTGAGGGALLDKMQKKSDPKPGTIAAQFNQKQSLAGPFSKIIQHNKGWSKALIGSGLTEVISGDNKALNKVKYGFVPGLLGIGSASSSISKKSGGSNTPRPISAPGKIIGAKLK